MQTFALTLIANFVIHVYSQIESSQQVTLSCPAKPEGSRGPTGVPGKRGIKGESGSRGKIRCNISERRFDALSKPFLFGGGQFASFPDDL